MTTNRVITDSLRDFSGVQGQAGWRYGHVAPSALDDLHLLTYYGRPSGTPDGRLSPYVSWAPADTTSGWNRVDPTFWHPNSSGSEQWTVRQWNSSIAGNINISGFDLSPFGGNTGIILRVDGRVVFTADSVQNVPMTFSLAAHVAIGSIVQFILTPEGSDGSDTTTSRFTISKGVLPLPPDPTHIQVTPHYPDPTTFTGTSGNDTLTGGTTDATLLGGAGKDWLSVASDVGHTTNLAGGRGNDTILGSVSDDIVSWTLGDGDDLVRLATGRNTLALVGWQDGAAVANGAKVGLWTVTLADETAVFTNSLGGSVTVLDWTLGANSVVDLTQPLPVAVNGVVTLRPDALLTDTSFAGLHDLTSLNLRGTGAQSVILAAQTEAAFGGSPIKLVAKASASLAVDGHALTHGFHATGGSGPDSFTGGAGNDSISDFVNGQDHIKVNGGDYHGYASLAAHFARIGADTVVQFSADNQVTLKRVDFHTLGANDFLFA